MRVDLRVLVPSEVVAVRSDATRQYADEEVVLVQQPSARGPALRDAYVIALDPPPVRPPTAVAAAGRAVDDRVVLDCDLLRLVARKADDGAHRGCHAAAVPTGEVDVVARFEIRPIELEEIDVGCRIVKQIARPRREGQWSVVRTTARVLVVPVVRHRRWIDPPFAVVGGDIEVAVVLPDVVDQLSAADVHPVVTLGGGALDVLVGKAFRTVDVALAAERAAAGSGDSRRAGSAPRC